MRKIYLFAAVILCLITSCKKDKNNQIAFSVKNMTTLINQSSSYIKDVSPGELDEYNEDSEYMFYYLEDEIEGIDEAYIYYQLDYDKCIFIDILSNYLNALDHAKIFMQMADSSLGTAMHYYISYYDAIDTLHEVKYSTFNDIWTLVDTAGIKVNAINEIYGLYHYDKYYILAGGYYSANTGGFMSLIEIGRYADIENTLDSTSARRAIRSEKNYLQFKPGNLAGRFKK